MTKVITKVYSCKDCGVTMLLESFTDEQTTLAMIKQNPYCENCDHISQTWVLTIALTSCKIWRKISKINTGA